ncbi:hypothetical protein LCGC14_2359570 [marine sediment metagenome]|uniref:Uncharacterized protein n=1 Tax=marine sediment metagenome TaxID=412755 RepID=A0A0F9CUB0_9ZZZZ
MNRYNYVKPGIYTSAPTIPMIYTKLTEGERHLRMMYRDILKNGHHVVKIERDGDDYIVYLEKDLNWEDNGTEGTVKSCYRLKAQ